MYDNYEEEIKKLNKIKTMYGPYFEKICKIIEGHCEQNDDLEFKHVGDLLHSDGLRMEITNVESITSNTMNKWQRLIEYEIGGQVTLKLDMDLSKIDLIFRCEKCAKKQLKNTCIYLFLMVIIYLRLYTINPQKYGF